MDLGSRAKFHLEFIQRQRHSGLMKPKFNFLALTQRATFGRTPALCPTPSSRWSTVAAASCCVSLCLLLTSLNNALLTSLTSLNGNHSIINLGNVLLYCYWRYRGPSVFISRARVLRPSPSPSPLTSLSWCETLIYFSERTMTFDLHPAQGPPVNRPAFICAENGNSASR